MRYLVFALVLLLLSAPVVELAEDYIESFVVHVYSDGSVSATIKIRIEEIRSTHPLVGADLTLNIEFDRNVISDLTLTTEFVEPFPLSIRTNGSAKTTNLDEKATTTTATLFFQLESPNGTLIVNATELNLTFHHETLKYHGSGRITISGTGQASELVGTVPMIIGFLNQQLQLDPVLKDTVRVVELSHKMLSQNVVELAFNVEVDYVTYITKTIPQRAREIIESVKSQVRATGQCPTELAFNFTLAGKTLTLRLQETARCNSTAYLETIAHTIRYLKEVFNYTAPPARPYSTPGIPSYPAELSVLLQALGRGGELLDDFTEKFVIKPSSLRVSARVDATGTALEFKTPKLAKRDAQDSSETLRALYEYAVDLFEQLGLDEDGRLRETRVAIVPEEGVKVRVNGTEVTEVKFGELEKAEVLVEEPVEEADKHLMLIAAVIVVVTAAGVASAVFLLRKR